MISRLDVMFVNKQHTAALVRFAVVEMRFKAPHKLLRSFVDPTGCHVIVVAMGSAGAVTMYVHKDKAEARELTKLKVGPHVIRQLCAI